MSFLFIEIFEKRHFSENFQNSRKFREKRNFKFYRENITNERAIGLGSIIKFDILRILQFRANIE